ncbi:MAG TPA: hypothetical protein P5114_03405 [Hyphomicrobiaceae bacterium]|nr:hypothetical protein [Hyphomicrobiaceae bacterium]
MWTQPALARLTGKAKWPTKSSNFSRDGILRSTKPIRSRLLRGFALVLMAAIAGSIPPAAAQANQLRSEFRATLDRNEAKAFDDYIAAQIFHDAALDAYWAHVEKERDVRRAKRRRKQPIAANDYVHEQPPVYQGPSLSKSLARRWWLFRQRRAEKRPEKPRTRLPSVADFLDSARKHYGFVPDRVSEHEFKERYAREALALGLSGDQVVRVYALETSGLGTADMQAGIHPITKKGEPISTAMGYAQLLAANSINELSKHGNEFVARLRAMAKRSAPGSERQHALLTKAAALARMTRKARSIPYRWSRHVSFSKTSVGRGIHAINLDGDIGPWLQVIKLKGLRTTARKAGYDRLKGAEIELMNLAGPGTGLEMMTPAGRKAASTNFFSRAAYYRNTIVRGKTSEQLLAALDERMDENLKNSGAVEFLAIFARLEKERRVGR